jgi:hypothetical protein
MITTALDVFFSPLGETKSNLPDHFPEMSWASLSFALQSYFARGVRHNPNGCNSAVWKSAE